MAHPLTEKYRPANLKEVLGNEEVILSLENILKTSLIPHMLFYGPPGTGKTTTIRAMAKTLYPTHYNSNVLELNASDERGIDTVREDIKTFASTTSLKNKKKIIILDEADSMSRDAQNALRRIIEDFSSNARFCFVANYSSKIIPAIQSRCTKFRFQPVSSKRITEKIKEICKNEGIKITDDGIQALVELSEGDMRKLINDLEGIAYSFPVISKTNVYNMAGMVEKDEILDLYNFMVNDSFEEIRLRAKMLRDRYSLSCDTILTEIGEVVKKSDLKNKMKILKEMADVEYRLNLGCSDDVQLNALIGVFVLNR